MARRTRSSNQEASPRVYHSKTVPQQVRFPHKRKTVRRPSSPALNMPRKRQMVFLPEKMAVRRTNAIRDSDSDDDDEDLESGGTAIHAQADVKVEHKVIKSARAGNQRSSDVMQQDESEDQDSVRAVPQGTRTVKRTRRSRQVLVEQSEDLRETGPERTFRRQSTMTQLVDGRRPLSDAEEPDFHPVKRSPWLYWGRKGWSKMTDRQQRTLTQMIPGIRPSETMSDEDIDDPPSGTETQIRDSQIYDDAVSHRLAQQGFYTPAGDTAVDMAAQQSTKQEVEPIKSKKADETAPLDHQDGWAALIIPTVEDTVTGNDGDQYKPTQLIDASVTGTTRNLRKRLKMQYDKVKPLSRFSSLSTPEKRRIRVIPSSQSPADSPLSTQESPLKTRRLPLDECPGNPINAPESPLKHKQVTFQVAPNKYKSPPNLKRFQSTIKDSEDEDDDLLEQAESLSPSRMNAPVQAQILPTNAPIPARPFGVRTQGILNGLNNESAHEDEVMAWSDREPSRPETVTPMLQYDVEPSPELGEVRTKINSSRGRSHTTNSYKSHRTPQDSGRERRVPPVIEQPVSRCNVRSSVSDDMASMEADISTSVDHLHSTPPIDAQLGQNTFPSTPMVIHDGSSDEEELSEPTPQRHVENTCPQSTSPNAHESADLDGEPILIPSSSFVRFETQHSYSSKAEEQLQHEWLSYSQYVNTRPPASSSMRVAHDTYSSKDTPMFVQHTTLLPQQLDLDPSQATTVDEITQRTPRKNRKDCVRVGGTTPHRLVSSQPFVTPNKPPPLIIPSSFPSPAKTAMQSWSSPLYGRTHDAFRSSQIGASLEDFSIPPPPPVDDD